MEISFPSVHYIPQLKATTYAFLAAKCKNRILDVIFAQKVRNQNNRGTFSLECKIERLELLKEFRVFGSKAHCSGQRPRIVARRANSCFIE